MTSTLLTAWSEHDAALDRLLGLAKHDICIFDHDLSALKLDRIARIENLRRLLLENPKHRLRIAVQDGSRVALRNPRLMRLQSEFSHNFSIVLTSDGVAHLADSLVVADACHALVRFHRDHARCKFIEDVADDAVPYLRRFEEILGEGCSVFSNRPAGL